MYEAARVEKLQIERNFGANSTEQFLFYDSNGHLLGQRMENFQNGIMKDYSVSRYNGVRNHNLVDATRSLSDVQQIRYTPNNEILSAHRYKTDIYTPVDYHTREIIPGENITRMRYNASKNAEGNLIENFSIADSHNTILANSIRSGNGDLLEISTKASKNIQEQIVNDPYLVMRSLPDELAAKATFRMFGQKENLRNLDNIDLSFNSMKGTGCEGVTINGNHINIMLQPCLSSNINVISHELRHCKQHELSDNFLTQFWNKFFNKKEYNSKALRLGLKWHKSTSFDIWRKYENKAIEADAFKTGDRREKNYLRITREFNGYFPDACEYTLGRGYSFSSLPHPERYHSSGSQVVFIKRHLFFFVLQLQEVLSPKSKYFWGS